MNFKSWTFPFVTTFYTTWPCWVRNGFGDALCIRLDCQYPGLRFVPLHPPLAFGSVLVWKKHQVAFPAVSALIVHAKKCLTGICDC